MRGAPEPPGGIGANPLALLTYNLRGPTRYECRGGTGLVEIVARSGTPARVQTEMLAFGVFKGDDLPSELGAAAGVLSGGEFSGKKGETVLLYAPDGLAARRSEERPVG